MEVSGGGCLATPALRRVKLSQHSALAGDFYVLISSRFPLMAETDTVEVVLSERNLSTARNFLNFIRSSIRVWHRFFHSCLLVGLIALNVSVGWTQGFDTRSPAVDPQSLFSLGLAWNWHPAPSRPRCGIHRR